MAQGADAVELGTPARRRLVIGEPVTRWERGPLKERANDGPIGGVVVVPAHLGGQGSCDGLGPLIGEQERDEPASGAAGASISPEGETPSIATVIDVPFVCTSDAMCRPVALLFCQSCRTAPSDNLRVLDPAVMRRLTGVT